jgi:hypothetical protein
MIYVITEKRVEMSQKGKSRIELFLLCTVNCVKIDSPNLRTVSTVKPATPSLQGRPKKKDE